MWWWFWKLRNTHSSSSSRLEHKAITTLDFHFLWSLAIFSTSAHTKPSSLRSAVKQFHVRWSLAFLCAAFFESPESSSAAELKSVFPNLSTRAMHVHSNVVEHQLWTDIHYTNWRQNQVYINRAFKEIIIIITFDIYKELVWSAILWGEEWRSEQSNVVQLKFVWSKCTVYVFQSLTIQKRNYWDFKSVWTAPKHTVLPTKSFSPWATCIIKASLQGLLLTTLYLTITPKNLTCSVKCSFFFSTGYSFMLLNNSK